jgi:DNA polymerase-3 subunit delta'
MTLPLPAATHELWGHELAERTLLQLAQSGRMPHGWIFAGPAGIGKATLAFRLARFLLFRGISSISPPDIAPQNLSVPVEAPVSSQIAAGSHPDLLVIDLEEEKRDISVEQIRAVPPFLSKTAAQNGWRIVIIDGAERMNRAAQNALLKALEEPSPNALVLLLAENTGALLPTIRSRSRVLRLQADGLQSPDIIAKFDPRFSSLSAASRAHLWKMAEYAPGQALQLLEGDALTTLNHLLDYLRSPAVDQADNLAHAWGYKPQFDISATVFLWVLHHIATGHDFGLATVRLPELLKLHEDSQTMLAEVRQLNLDGMACWHVLLTRTLEIFEG